MLMLSELQDQDHLYEHEFLNVLRYDDYLPIGDVILSYETILRESLEHIVAYINTKCLN